MRDAPERWMIQSKRRRGAPPRRGSSGFTLLEVLIAAGLAAVLLGGLWSLFGTYERLFSRGQAKAESAQLARALLERISHDLQNAIADSPAGSPGQSASVRRFGLFGTRRAMQLDVLEITDRQLVQSWGAEERREPPGAMERVPELHTVQYLFQEPHEPDPVELADPDAWTGLVRRELGWDTPTTGRGAGEGGNMVLRKGSAFASRTLDPMEISASHLDPEDTSLLEVPEVVGLEFRYYDGSVWSSQWNSLTRKSLPAAVEITLTLSTEPAGAPPAAVPETVEDESAEPPAFAASRPVQPRTGTHRLLVFLPATTLARVAAGGEPEWPEMADFPLAFPPPQPILPPAPASPDAPSDAPSALPPDSGSAIDSLRSVMADQWMRAGR